MSNRIRTLVFTLVLVLPAAAASQTTGQAATPPQTSGRADAAKIPITTRSEEARRLYVQAQQLADEFHFADAYAKYGEAVKADPDFALGYYGLATSAPTAAAFFENEKKAVALADRASPPERHLILALEAGTNSEPEKQLEHLTALLQAHPQDERVHFLMANYYNGRQDFERAIEHYSHAVTINPRFTPAYNVLGYANRALERNDEAEKAFRKYIELAPNEPNPYDSYAELLMKTGRFDESIVNYEKALEKDPQFVFSLVGIGNNQIFMDEPAEARATFKKMYDRAVNDGQRRTALFWTAASYVHEGNPAEALRTIEKMTAIAENSGDLAAASGDYVLRGNILLETGGNLDEALANYVKAIEVIEKADVSEEVKEATRRNHLYNEALVALKKGDLKTANEKTKSYRPKAEASGVAFEVQQAHELAGMIAAQEGNADVAIAELQQANQLDPRVLWMLSRAYEAKGDSARARELAEDVASFNQLNFNYAFVRKDAREAIARS